MNAKRALALLVAMAAWWAGCAGRVPPPDPACPDNLVLQNGEELPGRLLATSAGALRYELLSGEIRSYPLGDTVRVELGRRIGDPKVRKLEDLKDAEIVALVHEAMKAPPDPDHATTEVFDEWRVDVTDKNHTVVTWRRLTRVDKQAGLSAANESFTYDPSNAEARVDFGYAIAPDGAVSVLSAGAVRDASVNYGDRHGSQMRRLQLATPDVKVGGFVYYQFSSRRKFAGLRTFGDSHVEAHTNPVTFRRVVIRAPKSMPLRFYERNFDASVTKTERLEGGQRVVIYETRQPPVLQAEPHMPHWNAVAPYYFATVATDWPTIARQYQAALAPRLAGDPLVTAKAAELTAGKTGRAALEALYRFVLRDVRDSGVAMWDRDPLPRLPAQTLAANRGNVADRTALLAALAQASGWSADWLLTAGWRSHLPLNEAPWLMFLHTPLLRLTRDGETIWGAVGNENLPLGRLPDDLCNAFYLDPAHGATGATPAQGLTFNSDEQTYDVRLTGEGGATIVEEHRRTGAYAYPLRNLRRWNDRQLRDRMEKEVRDFAPRSRLLAYSIEGMNDLADPVVLRRTSECPLLTVSGGRFQMLRLFGVATKEIERVYPQRKYPLEFEGPYVEHWEYRFHLPSNLTVKELPPPLAADSPWGRTRASWTLAADQLTFKMEVVVEKLTMPAADFEKQEDYLRQRREYIETPLLLEPTK
jgi:hypothetical protein